MYNTVIQYIYILHTIQSYYKILTKFPVLYIPVTYLFYSCKLIPLDPLKSL